MNIRPFIINDIETPGLTSQIGEIQKLFNGLTYTHLPVQEAGTFMGNLAENDIREFDPLRTVDDYQYALEGFFARAEDNWVDVLHGFSKNQANIMPVLGADNEYLGYLELHDIINLFTEAPFLNYPGGIITVEKGENDYSFSEISQIVESNGARLFGAFVSKIEEDMAQITLKIGPTSFNAILQSFRRYGYKVISTHIEDNFSSNLQERSRYLDKYLNI